MIEIHFHRSTSKYYKEVLKHAQVFNFTEGEPNVVRIESADELFGHWNEFNLLFHKVKTWGGSVVYHFNKPLIQYKDKTDWFYSMQELHHCYYKFYRKSYDKKAYCNDGGCWGCKKLISVVRYVTPSIFEINFWFNYGSFIDQATWRVNKQHVLMVLLEEARQRRLDFCPAFTKGVIESFVNQLPDFIYIDDENWKVRYVTDLREHGQVLVPVGVEPIIKDATPDIVEPIETSPERRPSEDEWANDIIDQFLKRKNGKS